MSSALFCIGWAPLLQHPLMLTSSSALWALGRNSFRRCWHHRIQRHAPLCRRLVCSGIQNLLDVLDHLCHLGLLGSLARDLNIAQLPEIEVSGESVHTRISEQLDTWNRPQALQQGARASLARHSTPPSLTSPSFSSYSPSPVFPSIKQCAHTPAISSHSCDQALSRQSLKR